MLGALVGTLEGGPSPPHLSMRCPEQGGPTSNVMAPDSKRLEAEPLNGLVKSRPKLTQHHFHHPGAERGSGGGALLSGRSV